MPRQEAEGDPERDGDGDGGQRDHGAPPLAEDGEVEERAAGQRGEAAAAGVQAGEGGGDDDGEPGQRREELDGRRALAAHQAGGEQRGGDLEREGEDGGDGAGEVAEADRAEAGVVDQPVHAAESQRGQRQVKGGRHVLPEAGEGAAGEMGEGERGGEERQPERRAATGSRRAGAAGGADGARDRLHRFPLGHASRSRVAAAGMRFNRTAMTSGRPIWPTALPSSSTAKGWPEASTSRAKSATFVRASTVPARGAPSSGRMMARAERMRARGASRVKAAT